MKAFSILIVTILPGICIAQDLKSLENAQKFAANKVYSRDTYDVRFDGYTPIDSTHIAHEEFNGSGKITRYIEYGKSGKQLAEYHFEYDGKGKITKNTVTHLYSDWKEVELKLNFDQNGRITSREPIQPIRGLWAKETFTYSHQGILISSEQWYLNNGELIAVNKKDFPDSNEKIENSLSYIYDQKDLLIVEQLYTNGKSDLSRNFQYAFY